MNEMLELNQTVTEWLAAGRKLALATVVNTWGSAPRSIGAKMIIADDMAMAGSVSGGCVETAVVEEALASLADGQPRLLDYGVSDDSAWEVGLTCGGNIRIFVEPLDFEWWQAVQELISARDIATTVMVLAGPHAGAKVVYTPSGVPFISSDALELFEAGSLPRVAGPAELDGLQVMIDVHVRQPRLAIIGGVHIAIPLQGFALALGYEVVMIDPRKVFASRERFPNVARIMHDYPDKALTELGLDDITYVAVLTHDPKIDDLALKTALPSPAPYVGVLSSRRTHEKRVVRLREMGISEALIERIRTPIGLQIGAATPAEIALSIMAQIVALRNGSRSAD